MTMVGTLISEEDCDNINNCIIYETESLMQIYINF